MKLLLVALFMVLGCTPLSALEPPKLQEVLLLARVGNAEAQYHVGMMFNNGIHGAPMDPKQALEWFKKSAAGNDPLGAYKLGCYYAGQFPGTVSADAAKALEYKLAAARAGYALAQHDVAVIFHQAGNFVESGNWWRLAADQGLAPSAYNLATWHHEGKAGSRSPSMAYAYFKLSQLITRGHLTAKAQEGLDTMAKDMTSEEIESAQKFVAQWVPRPTEITLNARRASERIASLLKAQQATSQ